MKAVVISGPGRAAITDVAEPALGPDDVCVEVLAAGICGTDVELFEGTMPYLTSGMAHYPIIPGHEWAGEVREVGSGVLGFEVGDRVVGECSCGCMHCARCRAGHYHRCAHRTETGILNRYGAFAERIHFPAAYLHRISSNVPVEAACLVEPAAVAYNGVRRAEVSPGSDVAIFGDGPIGLLLLMMARAFGARSIAVVGASTERLAIAARLGADTTVNVQEEPVAAAFSRAGYSELPSVVIEATGNPKSIVEAVNTTAPGGRVVTMGIFAGQLLNGLNLDRIVVGEITLKGALGSPGVWPDVIRMIETRRIDPSVLVTDALALDDYHHAIERVRQRRGVKNLLRAN